MRRKRRRRQVRALTIAAMATSVRGLGRHTAVHAPVVAVHTGHVVPPGLRVATHRRAAAAPDNRTNLEVRTQKVEVQDVAEACF